MGKTQKPIEYIYTDDLTGEEVDLQFLQTVFFSYGGRDFSIDLAPENAHKLDELLNPYIEAASPMVRRSTKGTRSKASPKSIREWGNQNGYPSERGPLRKDLIDAYNAAFGIPA
ncbi:Lsr2 family protein [Microbacterium sp. CR_7]|uniref:histone-like nucleoid-structuring protein Lsr2 n=1 Tax=Microbacterium sp. CR_7 TaxID=3055792 RepID=UPI0035C21FED